jgi:lysozyme
MNLATLSAALIASWEGLKLTAYKDAGGVWTIGFGHTTGVKEGDICSASDARGWLAADCAALFQLVKDEPLVAAAAYVSFGYNCGKAALEHVLEGRAKLGEFVHVRGGYVNDDLVRRRAAEQALIDSVSPITA